ncbi:MAG: N-acetyl-gamma-glutamyl-phosphate reductase [Oscillospiraceae bacterium]|nr:N-acetyl-gamma-glutamyl-phosphate reductase [Oscillospiraceae bacterium]
MTKVFIDGSAGTTGLRIRERLADRRDIELITLSEELRKDLSARSDALNSADVAFLCLPDAAAKEAVSLIDSGVAVIDTSTAHRTAEGWTYGFPELTGQREKIAASRRVANPGCHASGFIVLVEPLVRAGLLDPSAALTCFSLTGYSGGGKSMIADYESPNRPEALSSPRQYGLTQSHKHLPEMAKICGLSTAPVFCPIVADFYSGMEVTVPVFAGDVRGTADDIRAVYAERYRGPVVTAAEPPEGMLAANALSGLDSMQVMVTGNDERILLISVFDNLGKGASGAAVQNMNIILGIDETTGLLL